MKTKEVTISNIKFNLSTEPLVSEPEVYPDYPSVPVNQITNKLITNLINYLPDYPWYEDEDGPIPGIKLFKDFNIYLEREYCEY